MATDQFHTSSALGGMSFQNTDDNNAQIDALPSPNPAESSVPQHPFLSQPLLHVTGLDPQLEDRDLATGVFASFLPVR